MGLCTARRGQLVDSVGVHRTEVEPFSEVEVHKLLVAEESDRLGAFYVVAMAIGLRAQEVLALTWDDLRLGDAPKVVVSKAVNRAAMSWGVGPLKTHRSRRTIPLPHTAASLLLAEGVPPRGDHGRAGHSTYQLTMDTYAHVMPSLLGEAASAMDRALTEAADRGG